MKILDKYLIVHLLILIAVISLEYIAIGTFTQATASQSDAYFYTIVLIAGMWLLNKFTPIGIFALNLIIYKNKTSILKAIMYQLIAIAIFLPSILLVLIHFLDAQSNLFSDIKLMGLLFAFILIVCFFKRTFVTSKEERQLKFNLYPTRSTVLDLHLQNPYSPKLMVLREEFFDSIEYLFSLNAKKVNAESIIFCKLNGEPRTAILQIITRLEQKGYKCSTQSNKHCFSKCFFIFFYFLWSIFRSKQRLKINLKQISKFWSTPSLSLSITKY